MGMLEYFKQMPIWHTHIRNKDLQRERQNETANKDTNKF